MSRRKERKSKSKKKKGIFIFILPILSIAIGIFAAMYIVRWVNENGVNKEILETIYEEIVEVDEDTGNTQIDFAKLKEKNSDVVGWLKVNGTTVDYPIVRGADNSYYLTHNFNKQENIAGWVFADYRDKADGTDRNLILHGHNMKDGSMFGTLKKNILTENWYNNEGNMDITYETEKAIFTYRVFSVYQVAEEKYYRTPQLSDDSYFTEWLNTVKSRSKKDFGVNLDVNSKVITLSTCATNDNYRVVLHAVQTAVTQKV